MTNEKMRQLLASLLSRTEAGRIEWSPGAREDTFQWSGASASVLLATADNDGLPPWLVRLVDHEGRLVEEEKFYKTNNSDDELVERLYDAARRNALDVDATINDLLHELGGPDEPPF